MANISVERKEIVFAYLTIHDFFDIYILHDARLYIETICSAANTKKLWKLQGPFGLIHFMEQLKHLTTAAFAICNNHGEREEAILEKEGHPGIPELQGCRGNKRGDSLWNCFPRSLTCKQFYDPYTALEKFCTYKTEPEWQKIFAELQEYALSERPIHELYPPYNMLKLQKLLLQLVEACHLLEVRTNTKKK